MYKRLAEALVKHFGFSHVTIRKVDWEKELLILVCHLGFTEEVPTLRLPLCENGGAFSEVATGGKAIAIFEGEELPSELRLALRFDHIRDLRLSPPIAIIPVKVKGQVISVLVMQGKKRNRGIIRQKKESLDLFFEMTGVVLENVLSQKELETELIRDKLTGQLKEEYFMKRMSQEFERAKRYGMPLSCCIFDIDASRLSNHISANIVEDEVLKQISELIPSLVRHSDIVARYSEKQFVVLFTHTVLPKARIVAEKICSFIAALIFPLKEEELRVTARFGISEFSSLYTKKPSDLLYYADVDLSKLKKTCDRNYPISKMQNKIIKKEKDVSLLGQTKKKGEIFDSFNLTQAIYQNEHITAFEISEENTKEKKEARDRELFETNIHAIAKNLKDWHRRANDLAEILKVGLRKLKGLRVVTSLAIRSSNWENFLLSLSTRENLIRALTVGIIVQLTIIAIVAYHTGEKHIFTPYNSTANIAVRAKSDLSLPNLFSYDKSLEERFKQTTQFEGDDQGQVVREGQLLQFYFKERKNVSTKHRLKKGSGWNISKEVVEPQREHLQITSPISPIASRKEASLKQILKRAYLYFEF